MNSILLRVLLGTTLVVAGWGSSSRSDFVSLNPNQDISIYSEAAVNIGKGNLFSGRTAQGNLRRAILEFDLSSIPSGAIINSVSLNLNLIKTGAAGADIFELHRVLKAWGEGTSVGTGSGGGQGTAPSAGSATWNFSQFSTTAWTAVGGDFAATSGTTSIGNTNGIYTFSSQSGMVADVQNWLNTPASNFGWILNAQTEGSLQNAREFGSRESALSLLPTLAVTYSITAVPEPGSLVFLGAAALVASAYRSSGRRRR